MTFPSTPDRFQLAPDLSISRIVTGLWQVADMERGGQTLDPDAMSFVLLDYARAGFDTFDMADHYGSAEIIAGKEPRKLDYRMIPRATYSSPQVASFGYTEAQAREAGFAVKVGKFNFQANGKALGLGEYQGWVKVVTDEKYGEILGATIVGPEASELLPELILAQANELTIEEIAHSVHAHPTLSEALMEAAEAALGSAIHS